MRTIQLGLCLLAAALLPAAPAAGGDGLYVRGAVGANIPPGSDRDTGPAVSGAVGYQITDTFRLEGELGYLTNDAEDQYFELEGFGTDRGSGDVTLGALMANAAYDFRQVNAPIVPYITGGIGMARLDAEIRSDLLGKILDDSDTVFAWQIGLGAKYEATENLDIDLGYRYFQTDDVELKDIAGNAHNDLGAYDTHTVTLGAQYNF
jgi:opacity protein-like surface antigen